MVIHTLHLPYQFHYKHLLQLWCWCLLFSRVPSANLAVQTTDIDETLEDEDEQFYSQNFRNCIQDWLGEFVLSHFVRRTSLPPSMNDTPTLNILSDVYTQDLRLFPPDGNALGGRGDKTLTHLLRIEKFQFTNNTTDQLIHTAISKCLHHHHCPPSSSLAANPIVS